MVLVQTEANTISAPNPGGDPVLDHVSKLSLAVFGRRRQLPLELGVHDGDELQGAPDVWMLGGDLPDASGNDSTHDLLQGNFVRRKRLQTQTGETRSVDSVVRTIEAWVPLLQDVQPLLPNLHHLFSSACFQAQSAATTLSSSLAFCIPFFHAECSALNRQKTQCLIKQTAIAFVIRHVFLLA